MINKKAESELLSFWLFLNLGLIGIFIVGGVLIFYSVSIDARLDEAKTLSNKLVDSISNNGYLNEKVLEKDFDVFNASSIDKKIIEDEFYFNLIILKNDKILKNFVAGQKDFEIQCALAGENFAKCYEREFFLINPSNPSEKFTIKIITGSNQMGSKV
jgi:hypothetical protein